MGWDGIKDYGFGSKNRTKEQDDDYRSRIKGVKKKKIWSDDKIQEFIDEMLTLYKKILMDDKKINIGNDSKLKSETIRDMNNMMNRLLQFKEKYYPTIQKSVSLNVNTTVDAVIERLNEWKKNKVIVVGGKDKEEEEEEDEES